MILPILIVDNNRDTADALVKLFSLYGRPSVAVGTIAAATAIVRDGPIRALVTDLRLSPEDGDGDGIDLLRIVESIHPGTPSVLMTGYADEHTEDAAKKAGAIAIVDKPAKGEDVLRALRIDPGSPEPKA